MLVAREAGKLCCHLQDAANWPGHVLLLQQGESWENVQGGQIPRASNEDDCTGWEHGHGGLEVARMVSLTFLPTKLRGHDTLLHVYCLNKWYTNLFWSSSTSLLGNGEWETGSDQKLVEYYIEPHTICTWSMPCTLCAISFVLKSYDWCLIHILLF